MRYRLPLVPATVVPDVDVAVQLQPLNPVANLSKVAPPKPVRDTSTFEVSGMKHYHKALPMAVGFAIGLTLAPPPTEAEIVVPVGCVAVAGFKWVDFVEHMNATNIVTTLSDAANDNVTMHIRLSPLAAYTAANSGASISASLGFGGSPFTFKPQPLIINAHNQPEDDFTFTELTAPPIPDIKAKMIDGFAIDVSILDPSGDSITLPGFSAIGRFGIEFFAQTTTDAVVFEQWFSRNDASSNTSNGYSGFTSFGDLTGTTDFAVGDEASNIEEFRKGIIDVERSIDDPDFDIKWMRAGLIVKKNGSNYDVSLIYNGAVYQSTSLPFVEGLNLVNWAPRTNVFGGAFDPEEVDAPDGFMAFYEDFGSTIVRTQDVGPGEQHVWRPSADFDTFPVPIVNMGCVKMGLYVKPAASNAVQFSTDPLYHPVTDPAYPL